jgi:coenzyme F420-reducing hydrogenase alpha subunit
MHTGRPGLKRLIKSDYLARVEGEGGFTVRIEDGKITGLNVRIFEAPRFFESFLKGRPFDDVVDFTARICGICPVAYQMTSAHAIEKIFGVEPSPPISQLRRLMYCGEWIESHALHVYLLHGPDFYGLESAFAGKQYLEIAKKGMRLKQLGNDILTLLGGRPVHPVSVKVGGFYKVPDRKMLAGLLSEVERCYEESLEGIMWASSLPFGDQSRDAEFVSLGHPDEYPFNEGDVISTGGLKMSAGDFLGVLQEYQTEHSTALYSGIKRGSSLSPYVLGPVSRLNLNHEKLPSEITGVMKDAGVTLPIRNNQMSIIARSVEIAYSFYEAMRVIRKYETPDKPFVEFEPRAGTAVWATEAPRGTLIHRYELDERGYVKGCSILPPTSQNLCQMEKDIYRFVEANIDKPSDFIRKEAEKIMRAYDPCISCSVHVVEL